MTSTDDDEKTVCVDYVNHRGERASRKITPIQLYWGHTDYHPEPQWLLQAVAHDRGEIRVFAIKNIHGWV